MTAWNEDNEASGSDVGASTWSYRCPIWVSAASTATPPEPLSEYKM